ncbi:MAG: hypothetical protein CYPHOPRED_000828 [Cyphobasidiales sp. Tagirdzhanova-0007]|nr:MAG: hypothetical protein CYPHOPRED_000828 [Cyphobasidiales sp. Tagirdzhanova-0007]
MTEQSGASSPDALMPVSPRTTTDTASKLDFGELCRKLGQRTKRSKTSKLHHHRRRSSSASSSSFAPPSHRHSVSKIRVIGRFATPVSTPAGTPPLSGNNTDTSFSDNSDVNCDADDELDEISRIELKNRGRSRNERKVLMTKYMNRV